LATVKSEGICSSFHRSFPSEFSIGVSLVRGLVFNPENRMDKWIILRIFIFIILKNSGFFLIYGASLNLQVFIYNHQSLNTIESIVAGKDSIRFKMLENTTVWPEYDDTWTKRNLCEFSFQVSSYNILWSEFLARLSKKFLNYLFWPCQGPKNYDFICNKKYRLFYRIPFRARASPGQVCNQIVDPYQASQNLTSEPWKRYT